MPFPNATLRSGHLSVRVFLPGEHDSYYRASRFDHGTMVGDIRFGNHTFFGDGWWRAPHDAEWTESGVGLASEWGCGEDGHQCAPEWERHGATHEEADMLAMNGVLGYSEAGHGQPFLKIGVGMLVKGSCPACGPPGGDDTYKFNSPYQFAAAPRWEYRRLSDSAMEMEQSASLPSADTRPSASEDESSAHKKLAVGYRLRRTVSLPDSNTVQMQTTIANTGSRAFRTPFYSHHFLSLDNQATGPPLELALNLLNLSAYTDCLPWAEPLGRYFHVDGGRGGGR